jgi:hypothetical protein
VIGLFLALVTVLPVGKIRAIDTPDDGGKSITIDWSAPVQPEPIEGFAVWRSDPTGHTVRVGFVGRQATQYTDNTVADRTPYRYRIMTKGPADSVFSGASAAVVSTPQWFHSGRVNVVVVMIIVFGLVLWYIDRARRGQPLFIRRIAGLDAIDEAVGRATEMGRPILYVPGLSGMSDIATIASMNILGEIARKTAQYEVSVIVPNADPIVYTVAREVVKEAYTRAGRPDFFNPDQVYFVTDNQFGYAAAVDGIMTREKPATNFFVGGFAAEALILAETGASTGAIQIAGTDYLLQLPFFVCSCDYTLIGEELYAASAYLSREPLLLGALKGQDICKAILLGLLLLLSAAALVSGFDVTNLFR